MADEPPLIDLAPLVITPQIAAAVRAQQPEEQPAASAETGGAVDQLKVWA